MAGQTQYVVTYGAGDYRLMRLSEIAEEDLSGKSVHSLRLSTGIFGEHDCKSGNASYAKRSRSEILVAVGEAGLENLMRLGGLPCPVCKPHEEPGFWDRFGDTIASSYGSGGILTYADYMDRERLPFGAENLDLAEILPLTGSDRSIMRAYADKLIRKALPAVRKIVPSANMKDLTPPNRLYIAKMAPGDAKLTELKTTLDKIGCAIPPVGYYDKDVPGHFFQYDLTGL